MIRRLPSKSRVASRGFWENRENIFKIFETIEHIFRKIEKNVEILRNFEKFWENFKNSENPCDHQRDGQRGSNVYEINPWLWQLGRGKPCLGGLSVEETYDRKDAAQKERMVRGAEPCRRRSADRAWLEVWLWTQYIPVCTVSVHCTNVFLLEYTGNSDFERNSMYQTTHSTGVMHTARIQQ